MCEQKQLSSLSKTVAINKVYSSHLLFTLPVFYEYKHSGIFHQQKLLIKQVNKKFNNHVVSFLKKSQQRCGYILKLSD